MNLNGLFTALVTPFEDGGLDLGALTTLCERQLAAGVDGLVPCGTTGETPTLDAAEWEAVVKTTLSVANGRVPVIAGCGTNSTATTVANIAHAKALGADAALVVFPYYNKPNPAGLRAHVEACCRVGLPIVLYHVPGRTGQHLEPAAVAALSEPAQIVGVKEATGNVDYGQELMRRTDVAVLSGDDFTAAPLISMGATGVISVVSNVAPRQTKALVTAAASGDAETMRTLQQQLLPLIRYLFSDSNPVGAKAALAELGLCKNELRLPLAPGIPPSAQLVAGVE